jgi:hypothetical protein
MGTDKIKFGEKNCDIEGRIVTETAAAIMLEHNGADCWFPLSAVNKIQRHAVGSGIPDILNVDIWVLRKRGLL